jgi:hypothetical protein
MQKRPLQDPGRFQDPLGAHAKAAAASHARHMQRYPPVADVYQAFYARFQPWGKDGMSYLGGAEGIIGSELKLEAFEEGLGFVARDGRRLATLDAEPAIRLTAVLDRGWVAHCILSSIVYCVEEKAFTGEFACICYSPQLDDDAKKALEAFTGSIVERIASATRPGLALTQEQFVRVVESRGAWFLTREEPWPELTRGSVFYRRRRTFADHLVSVALQGNKGCLVALWASMAVIVAGILWAAWFFIWPG